MNRASRGLLLTAFMFGLTFEAVAQTAGTFIPARNMIAPRGGHTATVLGNGKILLAGGRYDGLTGAELFDPVTGTFSATRDMIAGGFLANTNTILDSAELYDPSTGTFTATGSMGTARGWHTATLLYDG